MIPSAACMSASAFRQMRSDGVADFTKRADPAHNQRRATCRVCRCSIPKGEGFGYDEYMTDGYRFNRRYVCAKCEEKTR